MTFLDILPDLLRGSTSVICLLLLLPVLSKTKLQTKTHLLLIGGIVIVVSALSTQLYLSNNYTGVVYFSLVFYVIIIIGFKYLLKENLIQWLFNCVTVLNVYAIIVIISYFLAFMLPYPQYSITFLRLALFGLFTLLFKTFLRPLYLEVSENWAAFLLPTSGILVSYLYILLSLGDVESSMNANLTYFYFLTFITILTYIAIIFSLKSLRLKFLLREENIKIQANEVLLRSEITSYEGALISAKQTRHDIRHHNSILIDYLQRGDMEGAKDYLHLYDNSIRENVIRDFSKNPIANAVFRIYERRSRESDIEFIIQSEGDVFLNNLLPDIGILLSNLFENAYAACKECSFSHRYIRYTSYVQNDSILIEITNSVQGERIFKNGLPVTTKYGGGTGLMSVVSIINKYKGMIDLRQNKNEFITLIILPLI